MQQKLKITIETRGDDKVFFMKDLKGNLLCTVCLTFYEDDPGIVYLCSLYTEPEYRHMGYASILMAQAERYAKSHKIRCIYLQCAKENEQYLIHYYKKLGYSISGYDYDEGVQYTTMCKKL